MVLISLSLVLYDICNNYRAAVQRGRRPLQRPRTVRRGVPSDDELVHPVLRGLTGVIALIMWFVMSRITRSPLGRTFRAIRDDEVVAAALGKDVFRHQLKSMLIGSFYAGIGGGLIIQFGGSFNPTAWLPGETFVVFAVIIVGGVGNNIGLLVGALLVETLLGAPSGIPARLYPGTPGSSSTSTPWLIGVC